MSDVRLVWDSFKGFADFAIVANDLETDEGLETAVFISLFTHRRADESDELPVGQNDRQGWWADEFNKVQGDKIGSRLWLLAREKNRALALRLIQEYSAEALQWLTDDLVASAVDVSVSALPLQAGRDMAVISATIARPTGQQAVYRYQYNWSAQQARRA